jgi:hypothetical protein
MIFSENRFPSPIGVEDVLFGIMLPRYGIVRLRTFPIEPFQACLQFG